MSGPLRLAACDWDDVVGPSGDLVGRRGPSAAFLSRRAGWWREGPTRLAGRRCRHPDFSSPRGTVETEESFRISARDTIHHGSHGSERRISLVPAFQSMRSVSATVHLRVCWPWRPDQPVQDGSPAGRAELSPVGDSQPDRTCRSVKSETSRAHFTRRASARSETTSANSLSAGERQRKVRNIIPTFGIHERASYQIRTGFST